MCWMSVDFPLPVCPATPKNSPGSTVKVTSRRAHTASGALPQSAWRAASFLRRPRFFFASPPS